MYTTDALVCGTYRRNTADASYALLTAEAGLVYASARSVREERSRQRYALQDFAQIRVSLVRGKAGWRIGSVDSTTNFYHRATTRAQRGAVVQAVKVIRRFIQSEGVLPSVYARTLAVMNRLTQATDEEVGWLVRHFELWLLHELGYVVQSSIPSELCLEHSVDQWCPPTSAIAAKVDVVLTRAVAASQL
jgi:recombinational DNA repair protein (RecF pathway)